MNKLKFFLLALLLPLNAQALSVDTMLLVGDGRGNSTFSLTNNMGYTEFITAKITKYDVLDTGTGIDKTVYDETNVQDWEITLTHPKLILENGRTKAVGVRSLCSSNCNFDKDHVYQINFMPQPYTEDGTEAPTVAMLVGYAPLYIIPAANPRYDITVRHDGDTINVTNSGNSFVRLGLTTCEATDVAKTTCSATYTILAGRTRSFNLPDYMEGKTVQAVAVGHDQETFVRHFNLEVGETHKED